MAHSNSKPPSPSAAGGTGIRGPVPLGNHAGSRPQPLRPCVSSSEEASHELEKLEFALAEAITRVDLDRAEACRVAIDALGGNREEPGT